MPKTGYRNNGIIVGLRLLLGEKNAVERLF